MKKDGVWTVDPYLSCHLDDFVWSTTIVPMKKSIEESPLNKRLVGIQWNQNVKLKGARRSKKIHENSGEAHQHLMSCAAKVLWHLGRSAMVVGEFFFGF